MSDIFSKLNISKEKASHEAEIYAEKDLINWFTLKICLNLIQGLIVEDLKSTHLKIGNETTQEEFEKFRKAKIIEHRGKNPFEILRDELTGINYIKENFLSYVPKGFKLRESQLKFFEAFAEALETYPSTPNYAIRQLPNWIIEKITGTGKTLLFAIIAQVIPKNIQIGVITPYISIAEQTMQKWSEYFPGDTVSYLSSSDIDFYDKRFQKGTHGRVVVIVKDSLNEVFAPKVWIIDEQHLITGPVFDEKFPKVSKDSLVLQFTATALKLRIEPKYPDDIPIKVNPTTVHYVPKDGLKDIIFRENSEKLVENGELCPLAWRPVKSNISCKSLLIDKKSDDYEVESLAKFFEKNWNTICDDFISEYNNDPKKYRKVFVVCPNSIALATRAAEAFHEKTKNKESSVVISSKDCFLFENGVKTKIRRKIAEEKYKKGEIKALFQIRTMREGFDDPEIDCLWMMLFTKSVPDFVQALGRCRRVNPNDPDKISTVYDFLPNSVELYNPLSSPQVLGFTPELDQQSGQLMLGPKAKKSVSKPEIDIDTDSDNTTEPTTLKANTSNPEDYSDLLTINFKSIGDIAKILKLNPKLKSIKFSFNLIFRAIKEALGDITKDGNDLNSLMKIPDGGEPKIEDIDNPEIQNRIKFNPVLAYFYLEEILLRYQKEHQQKLIAQQQQQQIKVEIVSEKNKIITQILNKYSDHIHNTSRAYTIHLNPLTAYIRTILNSIDIEALTLIEKTTSEFTSIVEQILVDYQISPKSNWQLNLELTNTKKTPDKITPARSRTNKSPESKPTRHDDELLIFSNDSFQRGWNTITQLLAKDGIELEPLYNLDPETILPNKTPAKIDQSRTVFYAFIKFIVCDDANRFYSAKGYSTPREITSYKELLDRFLYPLDPNEYEDVMQRYATIFVESYLKTELITHNAYGNSKSKLFNNFEQLFNFHSLNLDYYFNVFGGRKISEFNQSVVDNKLFRSRLEIIAQNLENYDIGIHFNCENKPLDVLITLYKQRSKPSTDKGCMESWLYKQLNSQFRKTNGEISNSSLSDVFLEVEKIILLGYLRRNVARAYCSDIDLDPRILKYIEDNIIKRFDLWSPQTILGYRPLYEKVKEFIHQNPQIRESNNWFEQLKKEVSGGSFGKNEEKQEIARTPETFLNHFESNVFWHLNGLTRVFEINKLINEQLNSETIATLIEKVAKEIKLPIQEITQQIANKINIIIRNVRYDGGKNRFNLVPTIDELNDLKKKIIKIDGIGLLTEENIVAYRNSIDDYENSIKKLVETKKHNVSQTIRNEIIEQLYQMVIKDSFAKFLEKNEIDSKADLKNFSTDFLFKKITQKHPIVEDWLSLKLKDREKSIILIINNRSNTAIAQTNQITGDIFKTELDNVKNKTRQLVVNDYPDFDISYFNNTKLTAEFTKFMKLNPILSEEKLLEFATKIAEELNTFTIDSDKKLILDLNVFKEVTEMRSSFNLTYDQISLILKHLANINSLDKINPYDKAGKTKNKALDSYFFGYIYPRSCIFEILNFIDNEIIEDNDKLYFSLDLYRIINSSDPENLKALNNIPSSEIKLFDKKQYILYETR